MSVSVSKQGVVSAGGAVNANIAKNSLRNITPTSAYNIANFDLTTEVTSGTAYTCVIKGTIGTDKQFGLWMGGGYTHCGWFTNLGDGLFVLKFSGPASVSGNGSRTAINIYAYPSSNTNTSSLEWLKLEAGSSYTSWIPATTDTMYVGSACGFSEYGGTTPRFGKDFIEATEFIEI